MAFSGTESSSGNSFAETQVMGEVSRPSAQVARLTLPWMPLSRLEAQTMSLEPKSVSGEEFGDIRAALRSPSPRDS